MIAERYPGAYIALKCTVGHIVRMPEAQVSVLYPRITQAMEPETQAWTAGWDYITDLSRVLEYAMLSLRSYKVRKLFRYAYAFERASHLRQAPTRTPELATDIIPTGGKDHKLGQSPPELTVQATASGVPLERKPLIAGTFKRDQTRALRVFVDGDEVKEIMVSGDNWQVNLDSLTVWKGRPEEKAVPSPEKAMIVVIASGNNGRSTGKMVFA